jgi:hypothetical protein
MNILLVKLFIYNYIIIHNTYKYILHIIDITSRTSGPHPKSVPIRSGPTRSAVGSTDRTYPKKLDEK